MGSANASGRRTRTAGTRCARAVYRGISALSLDVPMGEEEATLGDMVQDPEGLKTLEPGGGGQCVRLHGL